MNVSQWVIHVNQEIRRNNPLGLLSYAYHQGVACTQILTCQMQCDETTRACQVDIKRCALQVKEPTEPIRQHSRRNTQRRMSFVRFQVRLKQIGVVIGKASCKHRSVQSNALFQRNSSCNSKSASSCQRLGVDSGSWESGFLNLPSSRA